MTKPQNPHLSSAGSDRGEYAPLVRNAARGDRQAMERLLIRAQEVAFRFSLLVCGHADDAEEVMQDALLKTYRHVSGIKNPEAFRTWLYQTVRNACLMKRRRRVGEPRQVLSLDEGVTDNNGERRPIDVEAQTRPADQQLMDAWVGDRLRTALAALPPAYRIVVVLREMEGLSTREVADITGISEANVKARLHRARMLLRQQLGDV